MRTHGSTSSTRERSESSADDLNSELWHQFFRWPQTDSMAVTFAFFNPTASQPLSHHVVWQVWSSSSFFLSQQCSSDKDIPMHRIPQWRRKPMFSWVHAQDKRLHSSCRGWQQTKVFWNHTSWKVSYVPEKEKKNNWERRAILRLAVK